MIYIILSNHVEEYYISKEIINRYLYNDDKNLKTAKDALITAAGRIYESIYSKL